jgi:gluconokinase
MTRAVVVMGVSGCGKSTLAQALAFKLGWRYVEGDSCHPPINIEKMASGRALDDADRWPFLKNVSLAINGGRETGVVASCSALKLAYRDLIRSLSGEVRFVLPLLTRAELLTRVQSRQQHFMPAALIDSQLEALEMPLEGEGVLLLDGSNSTTQQLEIVSSSLGLA